MPPEPSGVPVPGDRVLHGAAVSFGAMPEKNKPHAERGEQYAEHGKTRPGGFYKTFGIQQKIAQPGEGEQDHKSFHWQLRKMRCFCVFYGKARCAATQKL